VGDDRERGMEIKNRGKGRKKGSTTSNVQKKGRERKGGRRRRGSASGMWIGSAE